MSDMKIWMWFIFPIQTILVLFLLAFETHKENTLVTSIYYFYVDICTFYMCSILVNKAQMAFANKMH